MNKDRLVALISMAIGGAIVGSITYRLGIKDNKELSKAREDAAFNEGRLLTAIYTTELLWHNAVKYSDDEDHIKECENKFIGAKKELEQMGLWEKYRTLYPEEDE